MGTGGDGRESLTGWVPGVIQPAGGCSASEEQRKLGVGTRGGAMLRDPTGHELTRPREVHRTRQYHERHSRSIRGSPCLSRLREPERRADARSARRLSVSWVWHRIRRRRPGSDYRITPEQPLHLLVLRPKGRQQATPMSSDPSAYVAAVPCPQCGSKRATATPGEELEYECRDCGAAFDLPRVG